MISSPNVIHNMEGTLAELSLDYTNRTRKQIRTNKMMKESDLSCHAYPPDTHTLDL